MLASKFWSPQTLIPHHRLICCRNINIDSEIQAVKGRCRTRGRNEKFRSPECYELLKGRSNVILWHKIVCLVSCLSFMRVIFDDYFSLKRLSLAVSRMSSWLSGVTRVLNGVIGGGICVAGPCFGIKRRGWKDEKEKRRNLVHEMRVTSCYFFSYFHIQPAEYSYLYFPLRSVGRRSECFLPDF